MKAASLQILSQSLSLMKSLFKKVPNSSQYQVSHEAAVLNTRAKNDDENTSNEEDRKVLVENVVEKIINVDW